MVSQDIYALNHSFEEDLEWVARLQAITDLPVALQNLIVAVPGSAAMLDKDFNYIAVSFPWSDIFGLNRENLSGRGLLEILPEIPQLWRDDFDRVLAGENRTRMNDRFPRSSMGINYISWTAFPWFLENEPGGTTKTIGGLVIYTRTSEERIKR